MQNEPKYYVRVSDRGKNSNYITYIRDENNVAISPEFSSLALLIPWMRLNNFNWDEWDASGNNFEPWRVCRGNPRRIN